MNNRIIRGILFSIILFVFSAEALQAQLNPNLIQQARSMGITQQQIDSYMSGQSNPSLGTGYQQQYSNGSQYSYPQSFFQMDSSYRQVLTREQLEEMNPVLLEKMISDMLDEEGGMVDIRNRGIRTGQGTTSLGTSKTRGRNTIVVDGQEVDELEYYLEKEKDYEIVIRDGKYIKRMLPKVFGREVFTMRNLTFEPNYNMATPPDYVLGSGDEVVVEVWGPSELSSRQKLTPEGNITIQGLGVIPLGGLTMVQAQKRISSRVEQMMSGAEVLISLGNIRTIKVNVAGEALVPATYTLPSLASVYHALYFAGGVNNIGSLRNIKVYRNGQEVATVDVYDYLVKGQNSNIRLEDNDMIIVPPYENFVTIYGKVKRERTYEMKKGESLNQLLEYAGGVRGDAYTENIQIKRKTGRQNEIKTVDKGDFGAFVLNDGDSIFVDRIIDEYSNRLTIRGALWRPGEYEFSDQTNTLFKLIEKAEGLKGNEFGSRGQIIRRKKDYTHEIISFNPIAVASGQNDIILYAEDSIYIPTILELREDYRIVVGGEINRPDTLRYRDNMTIEDAILLGGGLKESASLARIEVSRRVKDPTSTTYSSRTADVYTFIIAKDLALTAEANKFILHPFDQIYVRRSPGYSEQKSVVLTGELLFEGTYVLATSGERISQVIEKAGGFTPEAYIRGASIKRKMSNDEIAKVESMLRMINTDNSRDTISLASLNVSTSYPIGVDFEKAMANPGSVEDLILRDGDVIYVPKFTSTVKISGAVSYPNSVVYSTKRVKDYISQAGGYSDMARRRPYVIFMNGKVNGTKGRFLFKRLPKVEPGAEIVVPVKVRSDGTGLATTLGILSSTTSMAAMIATMVSNLK